MAEFSPWSARAKTGALSVELSAAAEVVGGHEASLPDDVTSGPPGGAGGAGGAGGTSCSGPGGLEFGTV
ncbi:MAG: hypothetical protein M0005_02350 [Actinomycetota bacterium]|nr:hypothetical protein [Actinomycetota bacterium]